jgi:hypothetical protein
LFHQLVVSFSLCGCCFFCFFFIAYFDLDFLLIMGRVRSPDALSVLLATSLCLDHDGPVAEMSIRTSTTITAATPDSEQLPLSLLVLPSPAAARSFMKTVASHPARPAFNYSRLGQRMRGRPLPGNNIYIYIYVCIYVHMYVCMYVSIFCLIY